MKNQVTNYTFVKAGAGAGTVTFNDFAAIAINKILAIINTTKNVVIYQCNNPLLGGTVATNILTLTVDTSAQANTDQLLIYYDDSRKSVCVELDLTLLNPTTTSYTLGDAVGAAFSIAGAAKNSAGTGILQSIELINTIPSGSYRNQAVTATSATPCVFTLASHTLVNGNRIRFGATGTPPTGFTTGVDYYVIAAAANTFELAATPGGSAIASTSTGTSVTITQYPGGIPVCLYVNNATLGVVNDNDAFYPTEAQSQTKICAVNLASDPLISDYRDNDMSVRNLGIPYATIAGTSLYGVFVFTGTTGMALAAGSKFRARFNLIID